MAQFCTKCGTPFEEGIRFCTGCGAAIAAPSAAPDAPPPAVFGETLPVAPPVVEASPMPPAPVPGAPASAAPVPAAPAPKSTSPVVKIVLAVVALLIFFSLLGIGACVFVAYRIKQKATQFEKQVQTTFPMPTGTREVRTQPAAPPSSPDAASATPIDMGVLIYPGATAKDGGSQMSMGAGGIKVQQYLTTDSVDQVATFYKDKLGSKAMMTMGGGSAQVQVGGSNGYISITISPGGGDGKTVISITSITK